MTNRTSLLREIDEISFALNDLTLYLDTHPDCSEGLNEFAALAPRRAALLKEFSERFGPLTTDCLALPGMIKEPFRWCEEPAPWEGGSF